MENTMTHELNIIISEENKAIVEPGSLTVFTGDTISINVTGTNAFLFFPDKNLFGIQTAYIYNGRKILLTVREVRQSFQGSDMENGDEINRYPFAAYCDGINDFAEGASSPFMIVMRR